MKLNPNNTALKELMPINKQEVINKYGAPRFYGQFILDGLQKRYRIGLNIFFTEEKLLSKSLIIDELTWKKEEYAWVPLWYEVTRNGLESKNAYIGKKVTDLVNL